MNMFGKYEKIFLKVYIIRGFSRGRRNHFYTAGRIKNKGVAVLSCMYGTT